MENQTLTLPHKLLSAKTIREIHLTQTTRLSMEQLLRPTVAQQRTRRSRNGRLHRTNPMRRSPPHRSSTAKMSRLHRHKIRLATTSPAPIRPAMTRRAATPPETTMRAQISSKSTLPNHPRRYRSTSNPTARATTISGHRDIGIGRRPVITGCRARGYWRRMWVPCGHRDTGVSRATAMVGITVIGDPTSGSMAASITAMAITETAIKAATGIAGPSTTTVPLRE
jgi:hypothetical protein